MLRKILFNKPIAKFFFVIPIYIVLAILVERLEETHPVRLTITVLHVIIAIYFILLMIHILRHSIRQLMKSKNLFALIRTYMIFLLGIILIFTTIFNLTEISRTGYLTYGKCSDNFRPDMLKSDADRSRGFFYFTAVTFFTIGYGDICPMGMAKFVALATAFVGHLVSVILVALILYNFLDARKNGKK